MKTSSKLLAFQESYQKVHHIKANASNYDVTQASPQTMEMKESRKVNVQENWKFALFIVVISTQLIFPSSTLTKSRRHVRVTTCR